MAKFKKTYTNPKTGKVISTHEGRDTTDPAAWQKRMKSSAKDGDMISIFVQSDKNGKPRVKQVVTDYSDGTRSTTIFGITRKKKRKK